MLTDRKASTRRGAAALGVAAGAAGALLTTSAGPAAAAVADDPGCTKTDGQVVWLHKAATDAWYVGHDTEFSAYGRVDSGMHFVDASTGTYELQG